MNSDLVVFHKILFIDRPWLDASVSDHKYSQLLHETIARTFAQQPVYTLSFPKPLTPKTKYYHTVITNEAARFLNIAHALMRLASNDNERKFHIHTLLSKKLPEKWIETAKVIASQNLCFSLINDPSIDKKQQENAFIIQYLKYALIQLYLEIQDTFYEYNLEQEFSPQEISGLYFNEPFEPVIVKAGDTEAAQLKSKKLHSDKNFKVIKGDFRPGLTPKGILSYQEIIANTHIFAIAEEELFNVELIDENYNFTDKHTEKQKLAAVYHVFIRKGYFKKRNLAKLRNVKLVDMRKFLDHRYNTNLDAQFRAWKNNPDELASYLEKFPWMNQLPHA
jgi:hypothetical protein